jgi:hypothetical protein
MLKILIWYRWLDERIRVYGIETKQKGFNKSMCFGRRESMIPKSEQEMVLQIVKGWLLDILILFACINST